MHASASAAGAWRRRRSRLAVAVTALVAASSSTAWGWTTVTNTNGDTWNVNDALVPGVDTGSIHNTGHQLAAGLRRHPHEGPGQRAPERDPAARVRADAGQRDGVLEQGGGADRRRRGQALAAVQHRRLAGRASSTRSRTRPPRRSRSRSPSAARWATTPAPTRARSPRPSSGDAALTPADGWASFYSPTAGAGSATVNGTSATVDRHVRPRRQLPARPVHGGAAERPATRPTIPASSTRSRSRRARRARSCTSSSPG